MQKSLTVAVRRVWLVRELEEAEAPEEEEGAEGGGLERPGPLETRRRLGPGHRCPSGESQDSFSSSSKDLKSASDDGVC